MQEEAGPRGRGAGGGWGRTAGEDVGVGLQNLGSQAVSRPRSLPVRATMQVGTYHAH